MDDEKPINWDVPVKFELLLPGILVALAIVVGAAIFLIRRIVDDGRQDARRPRRPAPVRIRDDEGPVLARGPARRARGARNRMVQQAARQEESDEEVEQVQEEFEDDTGKTKKIGAKKARKLEMKAEKQAIREQALAEREDQKHRQEKLEEHQRQEAEKEEQERKQKEEEEEKQKAELERQQEEAYQLLKGSFEVHEEGFEKVLTETESQNLLQDFISYIQKEKVVLLEDLGAQFSMKTQDAIQRVHDLQKQGLLTGVIDDRGKFIYISQEELEGVAKFMQQRGRVSISELAEASNTLVFLNTKMETPTQQSVTA